MRRRMTYITQKNSIVRFSIERTWIIKCITRNTTSLIKLKWIPSSPFKQIPAFINIFSMKIPKTAKEFGFHYSHPHLQCLIFPIYPHHIHIEQEKHLSIWNTNKTIHAQIGGNEKLPCLYFLYFLLVFFQRKTKCLVKPIEKNPIFNTGGQQWCQKLNQPASARWCCSFSRSIPQRLKLNYWAKIFLSLLSEFKVWDGIKTINWLI